jgi:hypothetical protein
MYALPPIRSLLIVLLLLNVSAFGQKRSHSGVGLKAGAQMSTWRSAVGTYQPIPGGVVGVYFPIFMGPRFELQPELVGAMLGASRTIGEVKQPEVRSLYLQIPITAKLFLSNAFNLQGGAQFGQLMMAQQEGQDVTDAFNPIDIGLNFGLGLDMIRGWDLTMRYYSGMKPTLVDDDTLFPTNRSLQLTAGYRITQFKGFGARRRH